MKGTLAALLSLVLIVTPFVNNATNCLASIDSQQGARPSESVEGMPVPCERDAHGPLMHDAAPARVEPEPASWRAKKEPVSSDSVVQTALAYRGVPYRYAGMTSRGMDCSGLVSRVLKAHGIRAPHSSAALFKMGAAVSVKELHAGDLLFFVTRGRRVSHVGLYIGEGKFVHASSRSGGVITSSLSEAYYAKRYAGARRMF